MKTEKYGNFILLTLITLMLYGNTFINFHWLGFTISLLLFAVQFYNVYLKYVKRK